MTILPISADPPPSRALALILLLGLTFSCSPSPEPKREAPPADPSVLKPRVPVVREIGGRESHTYRLFLEPGQYVQVRIDQPGVDVAAKLVSPGGKEIPFFDDPRRLEEPDRLALVTTETGEHQLVVTTRVLEAPRGRYRLVLRELSKAEQETRERLDAEAAYEEGRRTFVGKESEEIRLKRLDLFNKALQLWEKTGDRPGQVDALFQVAEVYSALGDDEKAILSGERALRLAQRVEYVEGEARTRQALGNAFAQKSENWPEALQAYKQALELWKNLGDTDRQGLVLQSMSVILWLQRQFDQALDHAQRARHLHHTAGNLSGEANALVTWGAIQLDQGDTAQALENLQKALSLSRKALDEDVGAQALFNLARLYMVRGEYEAALRAFKEVQAINVRLGSRNSFGYILQALGSVYFNLGQPEKALAEYGQALKVSQKEKDAELQARLLANSGWIHQARGDLQKALELYDQAMSILEPSSQTLHNSGVAYTAIGQPEKGISFLERALKLRENQRTAEAATRLELGTAYQKSGKPGRATAYFRSSLELAERIGNTGLQAEGLFRWAMLDRDEGRLEEALRKIKRSLEIIESVRSRVVTDSLRTSFFASKREYYDFYLDLLMRLEELHPGKYQSEAFEASERARARSLLDLVAEGKIDVTEGVPDELKGREIELMARLSILQDLLGSKAVTTGDPQEAEALKKRLSQAQDEMERFESEIRTRYSHYAEMQYPAPLRLQEVQRLLDDGTALLQYFIGQDRAVLFIVTRDRLESYRLPPQAEIARRVAAVHQVLQERSLRSLRRYREAASRLYATLVAPAEATLARKPSLLIAPDGPLYVLPFEALLTDGASRSRSFRELPYLLRRHAISYIPSASVLEELRQPRAAAPRPAPISFLAFADPVYGAESKGAVVRGASMGPKRGKLEQLPASRAEVQKIASLYPEKQVQLYLGEAATEKNVKGNRLLEGATQVHFATHASVNPEHPELSGLELTDGTLQVREIFNLRLSADLLTLSACETGLGQQVTGEGMIGLTRAFFFAGAKSLLVSLWPVLDRSTPDLMVHFYENLKSSEQKADALQHAKLAMIESEDYSHPYYWAPFILAGDPD